MEESTVSLLTLPDRALHGLDSVESHHIGAIGQCRDSREAVFAWSQTAERSSAGHSLGNDSEAGVAGCF